MLLYQNVQADLSFISKLLTSSVLKTHFDPFYCVIFFSKRNSLYLHSVITLTQPHWIQIATTCKRNNFQQVFKSCIKLLLMSAPLTAAVSCLNHLTDKKVGCFYCKAIIRNKMYLSPRLSKMQNLFFWQRCKQK